MACAAEINTADIPQIIDLTTRLSARLGVLAGGGSAGSAPLLSSFGAGASMPAPAPAGLSGTGASKQGVASRMASAFGGLFKRTPGAASASPAATPATPAAPKPAVAAPAGGGPLTMDEIRARSAAGNFRGKPAAAPKPAAAIAAAGPAISSSIVEASLGIGGSNILPKPLRSAAAAPAARELSKNGEELQTLRITRGPAIAGAPSVNLNAALLAGRKLAPAATPATLAAPGLPTMKPSNGAAAPGLPTMKPSNGAAAPGSLPTMNLFKNAAAIAKKTQVGSARRRTANQKHRNISRRKTQRRSHH